MEKRRTACGEDNVDCEDTKWVNLNVNSRQREMARIFGGGARRKNGCQISDKQGRKRLSTGCQSPTVAPCVYYPSRKKTPRWSKFMAQRSMLPNNWEKHERRSILPQWNVGTDAGFHPCQGTHCCWLRDPFRFHLMCFAMANLTAVVVNVFSGA
jgi:hypothetical protein